MRKTLYISRILLSSFRKKLALIWAITLLVSFGLSMSIGIMQSQLIARRFHAESARANRALAGIARNL